MQVAIGNIAKATKLPGLHTHCIKRDHLARFQEEIVPGNTWPLLYTVRHSDSSFKLSTIVDRRIESDAMLDHYSWGFAIVPHQLIEVGYMHQQHIRVIDRVRGIGCMGFRRVMLQVDLRQAALPGAQNVELILEVVLWRLMDDEIKVK